VDTKCRTACAGGLYNDGTMTACQKCPDGRTSKDGKRCIFESCPQGALFLVMHSQMWLTAAPMGVSCCAARHRRHALQQLASLLCCAFVR
jgi:hypothetical protein